ncbi:MAG: dockerin type I domain-containing protein [Candidatus Bathyarchaeia archaeon]
MIKVQALALGYAITPALTLEVAPTVVTTGETVTLTGRLMIPRQFGDVNGDGRVDMKDIGIVSRAFGSYPGHPRWNPVADLNGDGKVDMRDISIVSRAFGQHAAVKPVEIYKSTDGTTWFYVQTIQTLSAGYFSTSVVITESVPATVYFKAYFPGGVY